MISRGGNLFPFFEMTAIFNFQSLLLVILLLICTSTYVKSQFPSLLKTNAGFSGVFYKLARIGERLSPYVGLCCIIMAVRLLIQ